MAYPKLQLQYTYINIICK